MNRLNRAIIFAIIFATNAHAGQLDKQGKQYIFHPLRVGLALVAAGAPLEAVVPPDMVGIEKRYKRALAVLDAAEPR